MATKQCTRSTATPDHCRRPHRRRRRRAPRDQPNHDVFVEEGTLDRHNARMAQSTYRCNRPLGLARPLLDLARHSRPHRVPQRTLGCRRGRPSSGGSRDPADADEDGGVARGHAAHLARVSPHVVRVPLRVPKRVHCDKPLRTPQRAAASRGSAARASCLRPRQRRQRAAAWRSRLGNAVSGISPLVPQM